MKTVTFFVFLVALVCYVKQTSAQQNWWERLPDGSTTVATSRTTTTSASPSQTSTQANNCPCVTTSQYNPVCGDNKVTYDNPALLECAQNCGQSVRLLFHGRCEKLA